MLHHFPHQAANGNWHAVYQCPGTTALHSIGDALCITGAQRMCDDANREQRAMHAQAMAAAMPPEERRIVKGFYTDEDAA